jgi:hypothetical protein
MSFCSFTGVAWVDQNKTLCALDVAANDKLNPVNSPAAYRVNGFIGVSKGTAGLPKLTQTATERLFACLQKRFW